MMEIDYTGLIISENPLDPRNLCSIFSPLSHNDFESWQFLYFSLIHDKLLSLSMESNFLGSCFDHSERQARVSFSGFFVGRAPLQRET